MTAGESAAGTRPLPRSILRGLRPLAFGLSLLGTGILVALTALVLADVILRGALNIPLRGVGALAGQALVALVFLQAPLAVAERRLIRSDFFPDWLKARSARAAVAWESCLALGTAIFFGAIAFAVWPRLLRAAAEGAFIGNPGDFTFPAWPKLAAVTGGAALAAIVALVQAADAGAKRP